MLMSGVSIGACGSFSITLSASSISESLWKRPLGGPLGGQDAGGLVVELGGGWVGSWSEGTFLGGTGGTILGLADSLGGRVGASVGLISSVGFSLVAFWGLSGSKAGFWAGLGAVKVQLMGGTKVVVVVWTEGPFAWDGGRGDKSTRVVTEDSVSDCLSELNLTLSEVGVGVGK